MTNDDDDQWEYALIGEGDLRKPWVTARGISTLTEGLAVIDEYRTDAPGLTWTLVKRHKINSWIPA